MFSEPIQVITICFLVFTLLAIVVTCETLTRKAQLRHTANHYTTQLNTLGTATQELLQAFNTVTAERDALRVERDAISSAYSKECDGAYCDRQALNAMTTERNELRTELEQSKEQSNELRTERDALVNLVSALIGNDTRREVCDVVSDLTSRLDGYGDWTISHYAECFYSDIQHA
jgi:uncharacterized coiled-coil DUF342 family protein